MVDVVSDLEVARVVEPYRSQRWPEVVGQIEAVELADVVIAFEAVQIPEAAALFVQRAWEIEVVKMSAVGELLAEGAYEMKNLFGIVNQIVPARSFETVTLCQPTGLLAKNLFENVASLELFESLEFVEKF